MSRGGSPCRSGVGAGREGGGAGREGGGAGGGAAGAEEAVAEDEEVVVVVVVAAAAAVAAATAEAAGRSISEGAASDVGAASGDRGGWVCAGAGVSGEAGRGTTTPSSCTGCGGGMWRRRCPAGGRGPAARLTGPPGPTPGAGTAAVAAAAAGGPVGAVAGAWAWA